MTIARASTRRRLTRAQQAELDQALIAITREMKPITVRGTFYQAEVQIPHIVFKDEKGYGIVQRRLVKLRKLGIVPYGWITDGTRWRHGHQRYADLKDFQAEAASLYRRDYWARSKIHVEIWIEKDALAGTIFPTVVDEWGVDLMVNKGFASVTYLYEAGQHIAYLSKSRRLAETHIYVLSDFDASGKCAARKVEEGLHEFAPKVNIQVHDLAVTRDQIVAWDLPSRPAKRGKGCHGAEKFIAQHGDRSVELDAIRPDRLRQLVSNAIASHANTRQIARLKKTEEEEKAAIESWTGLVNEDEDEYDFEDEE